MMIGEIVANFISSVARRLAFARMARCAYATSQRLSAENNLSEIPLNPRYERWRWITFGITWLIYAGFYLTRQSFAVAKVELGKDPSVALNRADYGLVDSAYLTTYMLGQFVFGALGDRFGPRRILLFGIAFSILAAIGSGSSTTLFAFLAFAVLQGVAQSTGWSNTSKTMSSWFSLRERGRVIGWWCTHYTVGAAVALYLAGWMMQHFGGLPTVGQAAWIVPYWQVVFWAPATVAEVVFADSTFVPYWPAAFLGAAAAFGIIFVLSWFFLRDRPEDVGLPSIEKYHDEPQSLLSVDDPRHPAADHSWKIVGEVLSTPSVWMLAIAYFPIKMARYAFYFWGPKYVSESLGVDVDKSALTAAAMPIGGLVGVIALGYISDSWFQHRRVPTAILALFGTAAIMFVGLSPIHNIWVMAAFLFCIGAFMFGPDSMISATAAIDFGTKRGAATAVGFINGIGSIGGILGGYLPGKITTGSDWSPMFYVMLLGLVVSALVLMPLWRVKPPTA
jgi:MFS transporter, OPA family, glycerol-3-phosphate transporter